MNFTMMHESANIKVNTQFVFHVCCYYTGNYEIFYAVTLVGAVCRTLVRSLPDSCNVKKMKKNSVNKGSSAFNPLNPELNPICCLLALLGAHHFFHISRIMVKSLTLRLLMSYIYIYIYIYMERLFLTFLDHTHRRSTVGRTPLDE